MFFFFWIPIILIGLTLFILKQLDDGSGKFKLPVWIFFFTYLYFIPIVNIAVFLYIMWVLSDDSIRLKEDSVLHKFRIMFGKFAKILNKEIDL